MDLAQAILRTSRLSGEFKLRSGQLSNTYFDKYLFESDPKLLGAIADLMVPLLADGPRYVRTMKYVLVLDCSGS